MFFNISQSRKKGLFSISLEQIPVRFCTLPFFGGVMRTHAHPQTLILLFALPKQPLWHMLSVLHLMEFKRSSQRVGPTGSLAPLLDGDKEHVLNSKPQNPPNPAWTSPIWKISTIPWVNTENEKSSPGLRLGEKQYLPVLPCTLNTLKMTQLTPCPAIRV